MEAETTRQWGRDGGRGGKVIDVGERTDAALVWPSCQTPGFPGTYGGPVTWPAAAVSSKALHSTNAPG